VSPTDGGCPTAHRTQAHYLLRAKVGTARDALIAGATVTASDGTITALKPNPLIKADYEKHLKLLRASNALLGDHSKLLTSPPWSKLAEFYVASDLKLSQIVDRLVPSPFAEKLGVTIDVSPADLKAVEAAIAIFRVILFDKAHAGDASP
jgi:hypothetical protein